MARYVRQASGLVREFRWWDVAFITIAAPTGSGILFYSVQTSGAPGGNIVVAFLIGMALFLPAVLAAAHLTAAMPRSGGPYVAVSRLVHPLIGYFAACMLFIGDGLVIGVLGFIIMQIGGAMLAVAGQAYHLSVLLQVGGKLASDPWAPIGAVVWVIFFWAIMLRPPALFRRIIATLLLLPLLTTVVCLALFFLTPPDQALATFNLVWGADAGAKIIAAAQANGWSPSAFSWSSTLQLLLVVVWAFNGIECSSYVGGEVQAPQRSYFRGLLLGWLVVGLLYMFTAMAVVHSFGNIIEPYHYLQANHPKVLATIIPPIAPSIPFYAMCLIKYPLAGLVIAVAFVFWFAKIIPSAFLMSSRLMFALAMDRLLPAKMADVNPVTTVPTWAIHATGVVGLVGAIFYYLKVETVLGTLMFLTMFIVWTMGLALIVLPFRTGSSSVGRPVVRKFLGLPLVSWLGIITFLSGVVLLYLAGREVPDKAWQVLLAVAVVLLANYVLRRVLYPVHRSTSDTSETIPPE